MKSQLIRKLLLLQLAYRVECLIRQNKTITMNTNTKVADMKKLTLTTNNANDSVQLTITNVMPHINGLTGLCSITLTHAMQVRLRDELAEILIGAYLSTGTI